MTGAALAQGYITTVAGNGTEGFSGDGHAAPAAQLNGPTAVTVDGQGNLYIGDSHNDRVRKVATDGTITTAAGGGTACDPPFGDGGAATRACLDHPYNVQVTPEGELLITDWEHHVVRKVDTKGIIGTVAGTPTDKGSDGTPLGTYLGGAQAVAQSPDGGFYVATKDELWKVSPDGRTIKRIAGGGTSADDGVPATEARLKEPTGLAVDASGALYLVDSGDNRVRRIGADGKITTVAGTGTAGFSGDGGPATEARLRSPWAVAIDGAGALYISEQGNGRVRKVAADGTIFTLAGTGTPEYSGDGGPAAKAGLNSPAGLGLDQGGNLCIADFENHRIRMVAGATKVRPPSPEDADLSVEPVFPAAAQQQGVSFLLGARVRNRGPATVKGDRVTVTLTLPEGLVGDAGCLQNICTRTFPGTELSPDVGSLDGTFRVHATDTAPPGTRTATVTVSYAYETNPSDNTAQLPITIVKPEPKPRDESALTIVQSVEASAGPGKETAIQVQLSASPAVRVSPGVITQTFKAPKGFVFTNAPTWAYPGGSTGHPDHSIEDQGKTLVVKSNPHVNTGADDQSPLTYTLPMRAESDASPGHSTDGSATIGKDAPIPLSGTVLGTAVKPVSTIGSTAGDDFHQKRNTDFTQIPTVEARDVNGTAVDGARIHFAIVDPNGTGSTFADGTSLTYDTTTRNGGIAHSLAVKAGPHPGDFTIDVTTLDGSGKAVFHLTVD
ncbi:hypothetical protein [Kitasatospora brasiliensis]|uniref:NHL domain-containing protein n=1 Tax=Kitasatospora brasiliensis TaxID=3058040 RepID=UPI00292D2C27|nr:hypothetical protein [Kitasatospora sp. K002]